MSSPPPPPSTPPTKRDSSSKSVNPPTPPPPLGPGARSHLLSPTKQTSSSFTAASSSEASETDPTIVALTEEYNQLKEELKKLEKAPTTKQASEGMLKYMAAEAEMGKEPLTRPLDANSRWANAPVGGCCTIL